MPHGNATHGLTKHPLHAVWWNMKTRCQNKTNKDWKDYGGRGITMATQWNKFESFYEWALAAGWKAGLTLERINNNLGYCSTNCRFTTRAEQAHNKRNNKLNWTFVHWIREGYKLGVTQRQLADIFGVRPAAIGKIVLNQQWKQ